MKQAKGKILTKDALKKLMEIEGEVRGVAPKSHAQFVFEKSGEEAVTKLENKMAELGLPVKYKHLKAMHFYPTRIEAVTLSAIKELFDFSEEDFRRLGAYQSKISLIIKLFMKYFVSIKMVAQKTPEMWREYYTIGQLKVTELNEAKRYTVVALEDFQTNVYHCRVLEGYFASVVKMVIKRRAVCRERKCPFLGDKYHEFLVKW